MIWAGSWKVTMADQMILIVQETSSWHMIMTACTSQHVHLNIRFFQLIALLVMSGCFQTEVECWMCARWQTKSLEVRKTNKDTFTYIKKQQQTNSIYASETIYCVPLRSNMSVWHTSSLSLHRPLVRCILPMIFTYEPGRVCDSPAGVAFVSPIRWSKTHYKTQKEHQLDTRVLWFVTEKSHSIIHWCVSIENNIEIFQPTYRIV